MIVWGVFPNCLNNNNYPLHAHNSLISSFLLFGFLLVDNDVGSGSADVTDVHFVDMRFERARPTELLTALVYPLIRYPLVTRQHWTSSVSRQQIAFTISVQVVPEEGVVLENEKYFHSALFIL